jgi:hypothetical protein
MPRAKATSLEKAKFIVYIVLAAITMLGAIFGVERYFAKESEVQAAVSELQKSDNSLSQRVEIAIIDDQIFQQEQTIQRFEDWQRFEQRKVEPELTPIEKETLAKAKDRLEKLEQRKEEKIKQYENGDGNESN